MKGSTVEDLNYTIGINDKAARDSIDKLVAKFKKFERTIARARKYVNDFATKLGSSFRKAGAASAKFFGSFAKNKFSSFTTSLQVAFTGLVASFVQINSEAQLLRARLVTVTGGVKQGEAAFQDMLDLATEMPFEVDSIVDSFAKFKAAGIQDARDYVVTLGDAIAAFGGKSENFKLAVVAVQQMIGKGVVSMEEMRRQLAEQIPTAFSIMAREAGMSIGQLMEKISSGTADSTEYVNKMMRGFKKSYKGAAARMMDTFYGSVVKARQQWKLFIIDIGDGNGAFSSLKDVVDSVATALENFRKSDTGKAMIDSMSKSLSMFFDNFNDTKNMEKLFSDMLGWIDRITVALRNGIKPLAEMVRIMSSAGGTLDELKLRSSGVSKIDSTDQFMYAMPELEKVRALQEKMDELQGESWLPFANSEELAKWNAELDIAVDKANTKLEEFTSKKRELTLTVDTDKAVQSVETFAVKNWQAVAEVKAGFTAMKQSAEKQMIELTKAVSKAIDKVNELDKVLSDKRSQFEMEEFQLDIDTSSAENALKKLQDKVTAFREKAASIDISTDKGKQDRIAALESAKRLLMQQQAVTKKATDDEVKYKLVQYEKMQRSMDSYSSESQRNKLEYLRRQYIEAAKSNQGQLTEADRRFTEEKKRQLHEINQDLLSIYQTQRDEAQSSYEKLDDLHSQYRDVFTAAEEGLSDFSVKNQTQLEDWKKRLAEIIDMYKSINKLPSQSNTDIPHRALGGTVDKRKPYFVGEKGPELFVPDARGSIVPNNKLGSTDKTVNINLSLGGETTVVQGTEQTVRDITRMFSRQSRLASS